MVGPNPERHWFITFGPFRVNRARRVVERDGAPVPIGSRAFDILAYLLERPGEVVSNRALLNAAWPTTNVEEGNLRFQITMLRQALGDKTYIINVPGRGYCFTALLSGHHETEEPSAPAHVQTQLGVAPRPTRLVGRAQAVHDVSALVCAHRMVTIVGTGGMGKSSVAITVAGEIGGRFRDGVRFIDLARVESIAAVPETVGLALGLPAPASTDAIVEILRAQKILLVVDGCEPAIGAVATLLERVLPAAPSIGILATSREALRIEHERVYGLEPLATPPGPTGLGQIMNFPAPLLFVESAPASIRSALTQHDAGHIVEICAKLNGVPLAIEIAASQSQVFGLQELAHLIDDRVSLDWPGRRTAPPRHRSLRAMLDWSYRLLTDREKKVFRSLAVFSRWFSLSEADEIANDKSLTSAAIATTVGELVAKTLLSTTQTKMRTRYCLPGVTRTFGRAKLSEEGEHDAARERHARHVLRSMQSPQTEGPIDDIADQMEDVRAALLWASSPGGDLALQKALARAITHRPD